MSDRVTMPVPRREAVSTLATVLADRTHWVIVGHQPNRGDVAADLLQQFPPGWSVYIDKASGVLYTNDWRVPWAVSLVEPAALVVIAPKATTSAAALGAVFGQEPEGEQDVVVLHDERHVYWPEVFVDALARVDPAAARSLRLHDVAAMN